MSIVVWMGLAALIVVALIVIFRYKVLSLAFPIVISGIVEIIILLGFMAFFKVPLDLAAFAGIISSIGTGVDSEIVITDEIMGRSKQVRESLIKRAKTALFIITTSIFTMMGVMGPIVMFSRSMPGLEKLYGFALVAIVGGYASYNKAWVTKVIENNARRERKRKVKSFKRIIFFLH